VSQEISVSGALGFYKSSIMGAANGRAIPAGLTPTMTGTAYSQGSMSVGTSAEAIPLGEVASPGWAYFRNCDSTNRINIRNGASGADLVELLAGEAMFFRFYRSAVPYAIANTAACKMEFLIIEL
jgi:hypothetical protein